MINGSWLSEIINEATSNIKHIIRKYLNEDSQHCCIFEDCNRKPTDPRDISSKNEYTFIEDDVYYFFNKKNIDEERFEWVLNASGGWYFLCVLSSLNQEDHNKWLPFTEISPILMDSVAKNVNVFLLKLMIAKDIWYGRKMMISCKI